MTNHFEGIQFFLDLLSEQGSQSVAGGNLAPSIILAASEGIVELDTRTEGYVSGQN